MFSKNDILLISSIIIAVSIEKDEIIKLALIIILFGKIFNIDLLTFIGLLAIAIERSELEIIGFIGLIIYLAHHKNPIPYVLISIPAIAQLFD